MRARRTDAKHAAVLDAIRALGYPCMSLHAHGKGLEDILVGLRQLDEVALEVHKSWVLVEVKTPRPSGNVTASSFTPAQREWYALTQGFPRLVVTSAQDAVEKLRRMTG
jgi:hypothetical protein